MSVLMSKDKKELIVTCNCKCGQSFSICIDDDEDYDYYAFLCFLKCNFDTKYDKNPSDLRANDPNLIKGSDLSDFIYECSY